MQDQDVFDIATILNGRWADADKLLKQVKAETDDGSPDWAEFHEIRLHSHMAACRKAQHLSDAYNAANKEQLDNIVKGMFGE
jgi:hypothetical protein